MKILIIEDDKIIRNELQTYLQLYGYEVLLIEDFNDCVNQVLKLDIDLILLDVNLPITDGYTICKQLRAQITTPIIIVTSRDTEVDEILSMNLGADDFIKKPYNLQILNARIERLMRRKYALNENIVTHKGITINLAKATMKYKDNEEVLTKNEIKIMSCLISNRGKIVTRDQLMNYMWNTDEFIDDNTLTVNITRLRKKIQDLGFENFIKTRRGLGYIVDEA
ncbi:MAG: response regulator transcription factor [Anaeroplasmataceae bacterium]